MQIVNDIKQNKQLQLSKLNLQEIGSCDLRQLIRKSRKLNSDDVYIHLENNKLFKNTILNDKLLNDELRKLCFFYIDKKEEKFFKL